MTGLLPYGYLVAAGANPQPGAWGDTSSLRGFLRHFLREEYGTLKLSAFQGDTEVNYLEETVLSTNDS